jgi:hypothetical protein
VGVNSQAYAACMLGRADAIGRNFCTFKDRDVSGRLTRLTLSWPSKGSRPGSSRLRLPIRSLLRPHQGSAWLVEARPARLCWEYLSQLAAYVELLGRTELEELVRLAERTADARELRRPIR